jgi:site-specific recombinase
MALNKIGMSDAGHAPFAKALFNSLNYGLGFVLIYVLHLTVATKQPAMTAAYIAQALETPGGAKARLEALTDLIVRTARNQFIAVVGNVLVTFTVALLIYYAMWAAYGGPSLSDAKADALLEDVSPHRSLAVVHAAIAGVCLFLSGLITGFGDNLSAYSRIPARVREHPTLKRVFGARICSLLADYTDKRLGGVLGNFLFGAMLGSTASLGAVLGLPLDIRHIAFSTANVAYALAHLQLAVDLRIVLGSLLGLGAIGLVNLVVSFTLALLVAMQARGVRFREAGPLVLSLGKRLLRTPGEFFRPPPEVPPPPKATEVSTGEAPRRDKASGAKEERVKDDVPAL